MAVKPSLRDRLEGSGIGIQLIEHTISDATVIQVPCFGFQVGNFEAANVAVEDWFGHTVTFHFASNGPHFVPCQPKLIKATGTDGDSVSPANTVILFCLE